MHAQDSIQMPSQDVLIMTKGQDQRRNYLPPLGRPSRDTLYLQLLLSTSGTSTGLSTGTLSSDSSLCSTPSSHLSAINNLTPDPASIRRTQSYHPYNAHPLVSPPQVFTTSGLHAARLNRGYRKQPSPAIRPGKCPHCNVVLKWPNGLRKHVQVSHSYSWLAFHIFMFMTSLDEKINLFLQVTKVAVAV